MTNDEQQGATGRRFWVSITLVLLGLALIVYGIAWNGLALVPGILLVLLFGMVAVGVQRGEASAGPLRAKADFRVAPPPSQGEDEGDEGTRGS